MVINKIVIIFVSLKNIIMTKIKENLIKQSDNKKFKVGENGIGRRTIFE